MKKNRLFKGIALAAAVTLFAGFAGGCGTKKNTTTAMEDPDTVPDTPYEINWYICANQQSDVASVENEINAYLKDKINATVKLNIMEAAQYSDKMTNMINAGEYFDMCYVSNWMLNYMVSAETGAFYPLDDLLPEYMPKTQELSDKDALECARVQGKIYALPTIKENASSVGWIYRKDIADKYNIDMSQVRNYEDLLPIARMIKENEPDISYPVDWSVNMGLSGDLNPMTVITGCNLGYRTGDDTFTIVNRLEQPEVIDQFKLANQYYKEGLIKSDILTNNSDPLQSLKNGKSFCVMMTLKPGKLQESIKNPKYDFAQVDITEPEIGVQPGMASMNAISATSKNPARVARFMELLNTDPVLNNLVTFGIEGKHYEKVSDNVIKLIPNSGYSLSDVKWMLANVFIGYTTTDEDPNVKIQLKEFNDSAKRTPLVNFQFDTSAVQTEIASCTAVENQYEKQVSLGAMDPEPIVEKYLADLKAAGVDTIQEELQRQLTEYLNNK